MRRQFFKRFLILLPAVWLIASAVFLLGKLIPGTALEIALQQAEETSLNAKYAEGRLADLRALRHRTGEDRPLFYFSLGTAAEPDTLSRVFPESDQVALQQLLLLHGNWPLVATYYRNLQRLKLSLPPGHNLKASLPLLLKPIPQAKALQIFIDLKTASGKIPDPDFQFLIVQAEESYTRMQKSEPGFKNYLPALHWHGTDNQYHRWFSGLVQGRLGESSRNGRPVESLLGEALGITFAISVAAFFITAFCALEIAMLLSRKSALPLRGFGLGFLYSLESVPLYIIALVVLGLAGAVPEEAGVVALVFPVLCLVLANLPYLTAQTYGALQEVLQQPYILSARARGLAEGRLIRRQALRPALSPVITLLSDFFPAMIAGTVILELVFSLPGMGRLLLDSVLARDYNVLAGIVLLTGGIKILMHLLSDIALVFTDPRLRRPAL